MDVAYDYVAPVQMLTTEKNRVRRRYKYAMMMKLFKLNKEYLFPALTIYFGLMFVK